MGKTRLEAFSDAVIAVIITIMVLEMKVPHGESTDALAPLMPVFLSYVLSFVYLGIYWTNHHHLLHAARTVSGPILWANLHLLFWLSLIPFGTAWMGENQFAPIPTAAYGVICVMAAVAYGILVRALIAREGPDSVIATAIGTDIKGRISPVLYILAIPVALALPWLAFGIYVFVALIWFVPDRRIERRLGPEAGHDHVAEAAARREP